MNSRIVINQFSDIVEHLRLTGSLLSPCTSMEVEAVEDFYGVSLPGVYKEFLLSMGKGATNYLTGSYIYYNYIFKLQEFAQEIIEESRLDKLKPDEFVFWSHQGYIYAYFKTKAGDNPGVSVVYDSGEVIHIDSLFEFFKSELHLNGFISSDNNLTKIE